MDPVTSPSPSRVAARYAALVDVGQVGKYWGHAGAGFLFTTGDRILLLKRSPWVNDPNVWGIPGGALPVDSQTGKQVSPMAGALKEVREEVGKVPSHQVIGKYVYRDGSFTFTTFIAETDEFTPTLNHESADWMWASREDLERLPLHYGVRELLKAKDPFTGPTPKTAAVSSRIRAAIEESMANLPEQVEWEVEQFARMVPVGRAPDLEKHTAALYKAFAPLRRALGSVTMYRGEPKDPPKIKRKWLSWSTSRNIASHFAAERGHHLIEAKIDAKDVVAALLSPYNENYIEYLVLDKPKYHEPSPTQIPLYYAFYMDLNPRYYLDFPENFEDLSDREKLEWEYPGWQRWLKDNAKAVERAGGKVLYSTPPKYDDSGPFLGVIMPPDKDLPPALAALDDAPGRPVPKYLGKVAGLKFVDEKSPRVQYAKRFKLTDPDAPDVSNEYLFAPKYRRHSQRRPYRRLKTPVLESPGVTDPKDVAYIDWKGGPGDVFLHLVIVRTGFGGKGLATKLLREFYRRHVAKGSTVRWGRILNPTSWHLYEKMQEERPDVTHLGSRFF